jgi:hypothetical protein
MNTTTLDLEAARTHFDLIWGAHLDALPAGAKLSHNWDVMEDRLSVTGTKEKFTSKPMLATQAASFLAAQIAAAETGNTYIGIGFLSPGVTRGRGKGADVIALPALWIDVDFDEGTGGNHKARGKSGFVHPTEQEALDLINGMFVEPTILVRTGGGFHAWYALDRLLIPEEFELLDRWKEHVISVFRKAERHIDEGPFDRTRVLRLAGMANRKTVIPFTQPDGTPILDPEGKQYFEPQSRPVTIHAINPDARYPVEFMQSIIPHPVAPEAVVKTRTINPANTQLGQAASDSVRDLWNSRVASSELFDHLGFKQLSRSLDGSAYYDAPDHAPNAWGLPGDELPTMEMGRVRTFANGSYCVYGEGTAARLGVKPDDGDTSWNLLACALCNGDFREAERLAELCGYDPQKAVALWIASGRTFASTHLPVTTSLLPRSDGWHLILEDFGIADETCEFRPMGVYQRKLIADEDGASKRKSEVWIQKLDWYPRISREIRYTGMRDTHSLYDVEVVTPYGIYTARELKPSEVDTPAEWRRGCGSVIHIPHEAALLAVLRTGAFRVQIEKRTVRVVYTAMGWREVSPGEWVYLTPRGSITKNGLDKSFEVGPPEGSPDPELPESMAAYGFDEIFEGDKLVAAGRETFTKWIATFGHLPELCYALLGGMFAAPLGLTIRGSVFVTAAGESGKSLAASAAQQFWGDFAPRAFPAAFQNLTKAGAEAMMGWARDAMVVFDDYKNTTSDRMAADRIATALDAIVRGAYGNIPSVKSTANGGMARSIESAAFPLITGEALPANSTTVQRLVVVGIKKGDLNVTGERCAIDEFIDLAGIPRAVYAAYVRWLAVKVNECGGLKAFKQWTGSLVKSEFAHYRGARSGETVMPIVVGLKLFREFAVENGFDDVFASESAIIEKSIRGLMESNAESILDANYAARSVETLVSELAVRRYSVDVHSELRAQLTPAHFSQLGWKDGLGRQEQAGQAIGELQIIEGRWQVMLHPSKLKPLLKDIADKTTNAQLAEWFGHLVRHRNDSIFWKVATGPRYIALDAADLFGSNWLMISQKDN